MIALLCAGTDLGANRPYFSNTNGINSFKRISSQLHLGNKKKSIRRKKIV